MNNISIKTPKGIRKIGPGQPVFIVAEMSGNHNQSFAHAKKIIDAVAKAGADAIKLQTYTADTLTIDSSSKYFKIKSGQWAGKTLHQLYKQAFTPWEWQPKLKEIGVVSKIFHERFNGRTNTIEIPPPPPT